MFLGLCVFRTVRFRLTLGESALEMLVYITLYLTLHCHQQNNSCIKMGSDESHFNVSLIAIRDKVTRQCPQTTTFEERGEPKRNRTVVLLLTSLAPYR